MEKDIKLIKRILEAIETSVDKESNPDWKESKSKLEKTFGKVSDSGDHEMANAKANYATVKDGGTKKLNTEPAFSKIKDPGANGGAKQNVTPNKQKNPYKEAAKPGEKPEVNEEFTYGEEKIPRFGKNNGAKQAQKPGVKPVAKPVAKPAPAKEIKEEEELKEISTNMKKITDRNPCINEEEDLNEISTNMKKMTDRNPAINEAAKFEATLPLETREKARKLREAIEAISGKRVVYFSRKK